MVRDIQLPAKKIDDLQILRGIAILLVLSKHFPWFVAILRAFPHQVTDPGWLGVDLFFVISGYVITRSLVRDRFEPLSFLVRRAFRLMPSLLLLVGLVGVLALAFDQIERPGLTRSDWLPEPASFWVAEASAVFGFASFRAPRDGGILAVAWSLSVEDQFYAALAGICLIGAVAFRRRAPRVLPMAILLLAAGVYITATWMRLHLLFTGNFKGTSFPPFFYFQAIRLDMLALGVVIGFVGPQFRRRVDAAFESWGSFWTPVLLAVPLALAAMCGLSLQLRHGLVIPVAGWCFGLLVLNAARERAFPSRHGLGCRILTYLGDRSYTIYLFHVPAMLPAVALVGTSIPGRPVGFYVAHAAITAAVLFATVELVYLLVERPLTHVGRRFSSHLRIIPAEPPPKIDADESPRPLVLSAA